MANSKMTQKDFFNEIIVLAEDANRQDIVDFCKGRIEILSRKRSQSTKKNEENEGIKNIILETLEGANPMTVTEMQSVNATLSNLSNQKISALLRQLVNAGKVEKTIEKKVSRFSLA